MIAGTDAMVGDLANLASAREFPVMRSNPEPVDDRECRTR